MHHHKYSLTELDNMMPWEREIYIGLLEEYIKSENKRQKEEQEKQTWRANGRREAAQLLYIARRGRRGLR